VFANLIHLPVDFFFYIFQCLRFKQSSKTIGSHTLKPYPSPSLSAVCPTPPPRPRHARYRRPSPACSATAACLPRRGHAPPAAFPGAPAVAAGLPWSAQPLARAAAGLLWRARRRRRPPWSAPPPPDAGTRLRWPSPARPPPPAFPCAPRRHTRCPALPRPTLLSRRRLSRGRSAAAAARATAADKMLPKNCRDSTFFKYCSTFSKY